MPSIKFDTIVETAKVVSGFRDIQNAVHETSERVAKDGKSIDDVINKIQNSFNIAIGGWSIGKFVNQMMQVRGQFQQTEMAFKTMLQSEEKANELMKQMIHTAAITPFGVEDVTEGAKQLLAFNVAAEDVNKTLIGLGDVAAGMGLNLSDMVMLYGTTIAKGKMDTMDLYQFLNRGIPIADELAKVMGLDLNNAIGEVQKKIKEGKVTSDIFIQAMQSMTSEGSKFGGLMEEQSKTITGQISNIEDAIEQMFNELGKSQEGVINTGLDIVSKLVDNWETVGKVLLTVVSAYGAYKAVVIALWAIEKARIALNSAIAFLQLTKYITSAKDAMLLFNMATKANPLGLLLGVIASAITLFKVFGDNSEDTAAQTEKFGEAAAKATSHVNSLVSILDTLGAKTNDQAKKSKVYKDTLNELSSIYKEYGIELTKIKDDESNLVDVKNEAIKKSQELVEQIKLESAERNRANAISNINEQYNNAVTDAQNELMNKMKDSYGDEGVGIALKIQDIVDEDTLKKLEELRKKIETLDQDSAEYSNTLRTYLTLNRQINDSAAAAAEGFGKKSDAARKAAYNYLAVIVKAKTTYNNQTEAANKAADATENFGSKSASASDRINEMQRQLQKAGEDVHTLYGRVKNFMENYSENGIKFHVQFDAEVPKWMENMDIPELGRMGKYFSALAKELAHSNKTGAKVNGKWMSLDKIAQRGYDYTKAANDKQTAAEDKAKKDAKAKADAEAEKKKKAKAASDAKKKADDQKKVQEQLNEDLKQLEQQNQDETISLMQEGTEKKLKEIDNDYKKRLAEIDKQETEFKKKNKEAGKSSSLTKEQSDALSKARDLAKQDYDKKNSDIYKDELSAMRDYLKEYGSLEQQKLAITEEYEEKIKQAQTKGEKLQLEQQKKQALANANFENISMGIDWKGLFSGVANISKEMLQPMLTQLEAYTQSSEFRGAGAENQQKVVELMQEIRSYIGTDQSVTWETLADAIEKFNQSVVDYQKAVEEEKKANAALQNAKDNLKSGKTTQDAFDKIKEESDKASQAVVDAREQMNTFGVQLNSATDSVKNYSSKLDAALNKMGTWKGVDGFSGIQDASNNISSLKGALDSVLPQMGDGMAKTIGTKMSAAMGTVTNTLGNGLSSLMSKGIGQIVGIVAQIPKIILQIADAIKNFVTGILNSFTELLQFNWLSDLVNSILDAVGNLIDAIFDLPENIFKALESILVKGVGGLLDTVLGRVGNVLSFGALSSKGPSSWFKNSNAEKVQKTITKLTDSNERLNDSISRLEKVMSSTYGNSAKEAYEEAKRQQEKVNNQALEIAKTQAGYHGSHKSWNKYLGSLRVGMTDDNQVYVTTAAKLLEAEVKKATGNQKSDLWSLTPEEMNKLLGSESAVNLIKGVGKGGYGDRVLEKLQDYADLAGEIDDLTDQFYESITQISFDSMKDNFISNLMDMEKSASDFSEDFAEMMQKALLTYSMEDLINGDLKKLYQEWADLMDTKNGAFDEKDVEKFQEEYQKIVDEGLKRRDEWAKVTGYTGDSSSQSATSGGWESMGQETADELNGRFTALQIAGETIASDMVTNVEQMETIVNLGISTNGAVLEIRNMMIMTNSYLEDVVKYAKLTYSEFGSKMDDMVKNLKKI